MPTNSLDIARELEQIERVWDSITKVPDHPQSTMAVIEYGLGQQKRAEVYINRMLCYLLNPENPHGMDTDLLKCFLEGLPSEVEFDEDTYDLADVRVDDQVPAENGESTGYIDLVLDVPGEWLLVIELKFSAAETGTEHYAQVSRIGGEQVSNYESGRYYLYLHQHGRPTASSDAFTNWTWRSFVDQVLDKVITDFAPRYPQRTTTQLYELRDDLRNITNMSDNQTAEDEKIELYVQHVDAVEDVRSTFNDAWDTYSEQWGGRLATQVDNEDSFRVHNELDNEHPEVILSRPEKDDERWIFLDTGGDWQHTFKYGWYKREETFETLSSRDSNRNDLRIGFYHRMVRHREKAVRDRELTFNFRNMGSNPSEFKKIYSDRFDTEKEQIRELLSGTNGTLTGNKLTKITATYDIPVDNSEGFFEAYTKALQNAFVDLIAENPELIAILDETFDDAVEEYRNSTG